MATKLSEASISNTFKHIWRPSLVASTSSYRPLFVHFIWDKLRYGHVSSA
jgi:hypothetical protein